MLPPLPVRETSWLGHHPGGAGVVMARAMLAVRMRAGAAITRRWERPPPAAGGSVVQAGPPPRPAP